MYGRFHKKLGLPLIFISFFFLFEPTYGLVDPLPDFVGYILLCIGITNLADINDRIMTALKGFQKCLALSVLRFASIFVLNRVFAPEERPMGLLVLVFIFAFFDIAILVPSYKALFEGLLSLGMFNNGDVLYYKRRENGRNRTEKIYSRTVSFVVVKNIICALPDFSTLKTNSEYEFIMVVRVLAILFVIPWSISWICSIASYFSKIMRDSAFVEALGKKYSEKSASMPEVYLYRGMSEGFTMLMISVILSFDVYSQDVNVLPDIFFFATLIFAALLLKRYASKWTPIIMVSLAGAPLSLFLFKIEKQYFERHFIGAIKRSAEAYDGYYFLLGIYIVQAVVCIAAALAISRFVYEIFIRHAIKDKADKQEKKEVKRGIKARLTAFVSLAIISQAASVLHICALPFFKRGKIYESSGVISSAISIAFVFAAWFVIGYMRSEIKHRYKID